MLTTTYNDDEEMIGGGEQQKTNNSKRLEGWGISSGQGDNPKASIVDDQEDRQWIEEKEEGCP